MALLDILDCSMDDLIEPVRLRERPGKSRKTSAAGGTGGRGTAPKRARMTPPDR